MNPPEGLLMFQTSSGSVWFRAFDTNSTEVSQTLPAGSKQDDGQAVASDEYLSPTAPVPQLTASLPSAPAASRQ